MLLATLIVFANPVPAEADTFDQRFDATFPHMAPITLSDPAASPATSHPTRSTASRSTDICQRHGLRKVWTDHHRRWHCK